MNSDSDLFEKIKKGNKQSFELLFRLYYVPLCIFTRQYLPDKDDCEEVVQGVFTYIWEKKSKLKIETSVKNYLYSSVRNRCLNYIKHMKVRNEYKNHIIQQEIEAEAEHFFEPGMIEKIHRSIEELPKRRREIFMLSREHGLKYKEIADELNLSVKTVEAQMGHALRDLREKLKDYKHILISFLILKKMQ